MASKYTEEQLNSLDRETLIRLFLSQQEQLENIDHTLRLVLERMADLKRHLFGRSSEKHETEYQMSFMEVDGKTVYFTKPKLLPQRKTHRKSRKAFPAESRRKSRANGKKTWTGCR